MIVPACGLHVRLNNAGASGLPKRAMLKLPSRRHCHSPGVAGASCQSVTTGGGGRGCGDGWAGVRGAGVGATQAPSSSNAAQAPYADRNFAPFAFIAVLWDQAHQRATPFGGPIGSIARPVVFLRRAIPHERHSRPACRKQAAWEIAGRSVAGRSRAGGKPQSGTSSGAGRPGLHRRSENCQTGPDAQRRCATGSARPRSSVGVAWRRQAGACARRISRSIQSVRWQWTSAVRPAALPMCC